MPIIAKVTGGGGGDYVPAPAGVHAAVCCDVVDLGLLEVAYGGKKKTQHKIRIVWQIDEVKADNKPYTVSKRYTNSLHEKATLRKDLESWRGVPFTTVELEGFDLEVLLSVPAMLNVIHNKKDGETYANVSTIMRLPKTMEAPKVRDWVRMQDRESAKSEPVGSQPSDSNWDGAITDDDVPF
jgi:hypothetical protein